MDLLQNHKNPHQPMAFAASDNFTISMLRLENQYLRNLLTEREQRRVAPDEAQLREQTSFAPSRFFKN